MKRKKTPAPTPYQHEVEAGIVSIRHAVKGIQDLVGFLEDQPRTAEFRQPGRLNAARHEFRKAIDWIEVTKKTPESFRDE